MLVGDGPAARRPGGRRTAPRVHFAGAQDPADFYAAADVVALPSRWEGGPLVPLEAMAMGRPVVAFDVAGRADGARRHRRRSSRRATSPGLAAGLARLLTDPDRAAAEGRAARRRALEVADLRTTLQHWEDVVTSVTEPRPEAARCASSACPR